MALLNVSPEVDMVEAPAIGVFNVVRPGPGPANADTTGPGFDVTHLVAEFFNFKPLGLQLDSKRVRSGRRLGAWWEGNFGNFGLRRLYQRWPLTQS